VTVLGQLLKAAVQMLSVVVLSRMLGPDDFGLIAMVTVAVALGELVLDFGLTAAALRSPTLTRAQASNLFWLNLALGTFLALTLFTIAPILSTLYDEPRIVPVAQVIAISLIINGLQAQVQVQLARAQRFTTIAVSDLAGQVLGFIAAVSTAAFGWGYWALVAQVLVNALTIAISRIAAARWIPALPKRGVGSSHLVKSGAHYAIAQLLTFAASNVDTFVIGARWNATTLGYYNRAFQLLTLPLSRLLTPLTNVAVPTLTKMQADSSSRSMNVRYVKVQTLLALPVAAVFAISAGAADTLVPLVLGQSWKPAVPLFQILALGGAIRALSHVTYWLFLITAPSKSFLVSSFVTKGITIALIVVGSFHSVEAVALLYSIGLLFNWPINLIWLKYTGGVDARPLFTAGLRIVLTTIPAAVTGYALQYLPLNTVLLTCFLQIAGSITVLLLTLLATSQGREDIRLGYDTAKSMIARS
jgi:PST family polysaccharide transporter